MQQKEGEMEIKKVNTLKTTTFYRQQPQINKPDAKPVLIGSHRAGLRRLRQESVLLAAIPEEKPLIERRAAVDVGSGGTKVCIADVDAKTNRIVKVYFEKSFSVPYQSYLEASEDGSFNEEIQKNGLRTFTEIKEILDQYEVAKVTAVATEAFRKASNGAAFAETVAKTTGIPLRVISQKEEGAIAFYSASNASGSAPEDLLIWDIGTGSFQIAAEDQETDLLVYMQSMGSVPFKNYIIRDVQGKDPAVVKSPNPMTEEEWLLADAKARELGRRAYPELKKQIRDLDGSIVGIGRLFANSVGPIGTRSGVITRDDLRAFIRSSLNKTDEELGDPFASVNLTNCILVLGVMKALHIHEIRIVETTSTKGLLSYGPYWSNP